MKTFLRLTLGILFSFGLASQLSAAPQFGRDRGREAQDRVCVFKDIHYVGVEQCFNAGDSVSNLQSLNGQISSIRIYGRATVTVYDDPDFRGHSAVFTSSMPDLGQVRLESKSWSDRIQSIRLFGRTNAVLYRDIGFGGARFVVNRDIPDLAQVSGYGFRNWNRQISSVRIQSERDYPRRIGRRRY